MPVRRLNPNKVKIYFSYTASELAQCLGVHKNTVRNWQREGLEPVDDSRPYLFQGATVRSFLKSRRARRKRTCPDGTLYCVSCREPRKPVDGMLDYLPMRETSGNLRGICEVCERLMHRSIRKAEIEAKMLDCDVKFQEAPSSLSGLGSPSENCDLNKEV